MCGLCNKISSSPALMPNFQMPAAQPAAPAQSGSPLDQLQQLMAGGGCGGSPQDIANLKRIIRQLDRAIVQQLLGMMGGATGGAGACGPSPAAAIPQGAIPQGAAIPQQGLMDPTAGLSRGEAVQAKVNEAAQRLQAATGINVPTQVIDDGQVNGRAGLNSNIIQSGVPLDAVPGAKFHEDAHVLLGDAAAGGSTRDKELRADEIAGYMLVKSGYGQKEIAAFAQVAAATADADHGTPQERVAAIERGVARAAQGG